MNLTVLAFREVYAVNDCCKECKTPVESQHFPIAAFKVELGLMVPFLVRVLTSFAWWGQKQESLPVSSFTAKFRTQAMDFVKPDIMCELVQMS